MEVVNLLQFSNRGQLRKRLEESYLPDGRLAQRISPRRKVSCWTELNRQRCADLQKRGLMTESGLKELEKAK